MASEQQTIEIKEETFTRSNKDIINYVRVGSGPVNLFLCGGTLDTWETAFKPILPLFDATKYTVVAWDAPGYGKSRPPDRKYTTNVCREDAICAHELMKSLNLLPYSALGWSEGARTVLISGALFGKDVTCIIEWGGTPFVNAFISKYFRAMRNVADWPDYAAQKRWETYYTKEYLYKTWAAQSDFYCGVFQCVPKASLLMEYLPNVKQPVMVIDPLRDAMFPSDQRAPIEHFLKELKNVTHVQKSDGGHNVHIQHPKWFIETVTKFVDKHSSK